MVIIETITIAFNFDNIKYVPDGMEEAVNKLIWNMPYVEATQDLHSGFSIDVSYGDYCEIGEEEYLELVKQTVISIEKMCTEFEMACNKFVDL